MNEQTEQPPRNRWDFIHFGVMFFGFILAATGMIVNSIAAALVGLALMGIGLLYFAFRQSDFD